MKKTKTINELTRVLDLHQRHTMKREYHESVVQYITGTLGIYHLKILTLLKEQFDCSGKVRRFVIEVEGLEYVLCYYPVNEGTFELFPLDSLEIRGTEP